MARSGRGVCRPAGQLARYRNRARGPSSQPVPARGDAQLMPIAPRDSIGDAGREPSHGTRHIVRTPSRLGGRALPAIPGPHGVRSARQLMGELPWSSFGPVIRAHRQNVHIMDSPWGPTQECNPSTIGCNCRAAVARPRPCQQPDLQGLHRDERQSRLSVRIREVPQENPFAVRRPAHERHPHSASGRRPRPDGNAEVQYITFRAAEGRHGHEVYVRLPAHPPHERDRPAVRGPGRNRPQPDEWSIAGARRCPET
jgi:hypothetical protein